MHLLKLEAHQILGQKWEYFRKIKNAGQSSGLFREKSLFEEMKATQSAIKFTAKNTLRQYNLAYQNALKEIKSFAITDEEFPDLPDENDADAVKAMIPEQDAVIISWTPVKFFLPARQIREKGTASQRHTEGLIAKLFFKVAAYYAEPENWDARKLSFYLHKITAASSYQEVAEKLEPLKKDLYTFSEEFEPFKFGQASLSRDITSDSDAFDDAMEVESFEDQVRTLYWHGFIYRAMESFMLRYFLTLVSATASAHAVRYLANIFEAALTRVVDLSILFDGSFDTDTSRKRFRKAYATLRKARNGEKATRTIKTRQGLFEVYNHNLDLLARYGAPFNVSKDNDHDSFWWQFAETHILGKNKTNLEEELTYTAYHPLGKEIADSERQNGALAGQVVELTEAVTSLKSELEGVKREKDNLEKTYRNEDPEAIRKQLQERKQRAESESKELEQNLKNQQEQKETFSGQLKQLAQERDQLLEAEEPLKQKQAEFSKTVAEFEKDGNTEQKAEADKRLAEIEEQLDAIAKKRNDELAPGFETAQNQLTAALKEIEVLDRSLLAIRKQLKQIDEEITALEERDARFAESRKKLESALKNTEKNLEKETRTLDDTRLKIEENKQQITGLTEKRQVVLKETEQKLKDLNRPEARSLALMHILTLLITCSGKRKEAWEKVLSRFKDRITADQELAKGRIDEIKKESAKKVREMTKKASKLKRLKQESAALAFEKEIDTYQKGVDAKCTQILKNAKDEADFQKERLSNLFQIVARDKKRSDALPARRLFDLILQMEGGEAFKKSFMTFLIASTADKYEKNLEPLYKNLFAVFNPTLLNRVSLVQALQKSGGDGGIKLKLGEEDQKAVDSIIQGSRNQLKQQKPDIFDSQVAIQSTNASLDTLLKIKLDSDSLKPVLLLKFTTQANPRGERLETSIMERILHLNRIVNPVPEHHLLLEGKENEKDPLQRINTSQLKKLVSDTAAVT